MIASTIKTADPEPVVEVTTTEITLSEMKSDNNITPTELKNDLPEEVVSPTMEAHFRMKIPENLIYQRILQ